MDEKTTASPTSCKNCGAEVSAKFCANCGQSAHVGRITFRETINGLLSSTFALEGPLLHTVKLLVTNPGKVFREFIAGKRKTYYKPVAFFVVMTALYIILRQMIGFDPLEGQMDTTRPGLGQAQRKTQEAARFMVDNINNIMFTLVFSIGIMLKLFFRKRYNLAEFVTVGFYISGMYILFGIPLMILTNYTGMNFQQIQLLILIGYVFYSQVSFIGSRKIGGYVKYLFVSVLSLVFYVGLGYGFSLLIVLLFR